LVFLCLHSMVECLNVIISEGEGLGYVFYWVIWLFAMMHLIRWIHVAFLFFLLLPIALCSNGKLGVLLTGTVDERSNPLLDWFNIEPILETRVVPSRGVTSGVPLDDGDMKRFIRLYFPRKYGDVASYDLLLLNTPLIYLFDDHQLQWMFDAIQNGTGGLVAPSCLSVYAEIYEPWIASRLQHAFPGDPAAVISGRGGPGVEDVWFNVIVNRDFPSPILTPFLSLGIEKFTGAYAYFIVPRQGAYIVAWEEGCFPSVGRVPYMVTWEYGRGRTMTLADTFGQVAGTNSGAFWNPYALRPSGNQYSFDVLMNMVTYLVGEEPTVDIMTRHRVRNSLVEYRTKMALLLSLVDFVERFGTTYQGTFEILSNLEDIHREAMAEYLANNFERSQELLDELLSYSYPEANRELMELKDRELLWVHITEWLVVCSALFISFSLVWTFMVNRYLYRNINTTRLR